jgi:sigma-B regulation protein RsbU (phosphoserine phosphatase)
LNVQSQTAAHAARWQVLSLGEQLVAQPTVVAQSELIVETAARLIKGQANLWLTEALHRLPGSEGPPLFPAEPPSSLMRRALDVGRGSNLAAPSPPPEERFEHVQPLEDVPDAYSLLPTPYSLLKVVTTGSSVAVPLLAHDTTLGVLEMNRPDGPPFSDDEIELLYALATQSAIALQAARQVAIERWRLEQLSLVRTVSGQVADVLDLDELADRVTNLIRDTFKVYYVALFTMEPAQELALAASAGRPDRGETPPVLHIRPDRGETPPVLHIRLGQGIIGHVAQTGTEILTGDVRHEPHYRSVDALPETRSEVALPLKIEERVLGVLDVQSDQPDDFDETNLLVLRALADQIAIAVEGARLYSDLRHRADQLSAVAEVSRAVASILDLEALLKEVVRLIREQFGYPFVYLFTVDPARGQIVYRAGLPLPPRREEPEGGGLICSLDDSDGIIPWVVCHGETVLTNDVSRDPRYRHSALPPADTRAELAVPLIFGGEVLGALDVRSDRRDVFTDDDRLLFEALADSVAIAIRNASLYRSERWRHQVADSMRELAGLLSANVDPEQVLQAILTELERTLPCDVAAIWLLHDGRLCLSAVHGYAAETCISDFSPDVSPWLTEALNADQPVIRSPQSPYEPLGNALAFPSDYSAIAAPLRAGDRRLGLLTMAHHTPGRYGSESRAMTAAFASYAAVAIENTRLYQEAQETARISTAMLQVAKATQSLTTLEQVIETVVQLVPMLVGTDRCAILLWDEPTAAFVPVASFGLDPAQEETFDQWHVALGDEPAFDDLRLNKTPIFVYDVATDSRLSGPAVWALGFESLLMLPLLAQGEVLGTLLIDYQSDWFEFSTVETGHDERLMIIQGIALQTAAAVENTLLRQAQQEEAYVSAALLQVAQAVASSNNLDDVLSTIVRIVPILIGVDRCILFLWDNERCVFRPAHVYGVSRDAKATLLAQRYAPGEFPLLDAVRERGRLVVHALDGAPDAHGEGGAGHEQATSPLPPDFAAEFAPASAQAPQVEPRSLLAVPLSVRSDVLGVMALEQVGTQRRSRQTTNTRRIEIITGIAHQAALAMQNDQLRQEMAERERLERELQLAHEIQQALIPGELPQPPGWDLAATWRAARQVAGDFYDVFELPDGRLGLVIADVADKGMPAALFMTLTRTLMRAAALEETSPAAAIGRANDLLVPDARHGMFVTALYAVLSLETGELAYANAGHNLPLLLRSRTSELERLCKGGMALGVLAGVRSEEHVISLAPGDYLIFYTDGITEAFSPEGDIYGEERLQTIIQAAGDGPAQAMLDTIDSSVAAFAGDGPLSDDRTLMVLRRESPTTSS